MKNIFLEKSVTKYGGEISPRPFSKQSKVSIYLDELSIVLYSLILLHVETKVQTTCFYLLESSFKKKKGLELVFLPHFLHDF